MEPGLEMLVSEGISSLTDDKEYTMICNKPGTLYPATSEFKAGFMKVVLLALFATGRNGATAVAAPAVDDQPRQQDRLSLCQKPASQQNCTLKPGSSLPLPVTATEKEWIVAAHVSRVPTGGVHDPRCKMGNVRNNKHCSPPAHRELPHQYFKRAMEMTLSTISDVDPGASVELLVFTEGFRGGMVDEMGLPVDWDIPREICLGLGIECAQVRSGMGESSAVGVSKCLTTDRSECNVRTWIFVKHSLPYEEG